MANIKKMYEKIQIFWNRAKYAEAKESFLETTLAKQLITDWKKHVKEDKLDKLTEAFANVYAMGKTGYIPRYKKKKR